MRVLVTGAAGFIGSRLCRRLLDDGPRRLRRGLSHRLLSPLDQAPEPCARSSPTAGSNSSRPTSTTCPLGRILRSVEAVYHLAAQAGVRASWGKSFASYLRHNIAATQRLLEAAKDRPLRKIVYASSSSVYGLTPDLPMTETSPLLPDLALRRDQAWRPNSSVFSTTRISACRWFRSAFSPSTVPARGRTWPSTSFSRPSSKAGKSRSSATDPRRAISPTSTTSSRRSGPPNETGRPAKCYNIGGGHREQLSSLFPVLEEITGRPVKIRTRRHPERGRPPHVRFDRQSPARPGLRSADDARATVSSANGPIFTICTKSGAVPPPDPRMIIHEKHQTRRGRAVVLMIAASACAAREKQAVISPGPSPAPTRPCTRKASS